MTDEDVETMLSKMRGMQKEMKEKLGSILDKAGTNPAAIEKFLSDPKNFNDTEWKQIQQAKESTLKKLIKDLEPFAKQTAKQEPGKAAIKKKAKAAAARKNWIPMQ